MHRKITNSLSQGVGKDQALNLAMGKARNFDEAFLNLSAKGTVTAKLFDTLARQEGIDALPNVDRNTRSWRNFLCSRTKNINKSHT